jgi:hypothetical protein
MRVAHSRRWEEVLTMSMTLESADVVRILALEQRPCRVSKRGRLAAEATKCDMLRRTGAIPSDAFEHSAIHSAESSATKARGVPDKPTQSVRYRAQAGSESCARLEGNDLVVMRDASLPRCA